jgi:hypothetical protein
MIVMAPAPHFEEAKGTCVAEDNPTLWLPDSALCPLFSSIHFLEVFIL